ncbi:MAG: NAD(P)H:quinone oxidoreductase [Candidatus Methanogasteraceae archaeon]
MMELLSEGLEMPEGCLERRFALKPRSMHLLSGYGNFSPIFLPFRIGTRSSVGQMRQFLDATGGLWKGAALAGKLGSVFVSSATQHGGQESTILSFHVTLLHHGMIIVGLPYLFEGQARIDEITGGSPYGASTIAGNSQERMPSENELAAARFQGKYIAMVASELAGHREEVIDAMRR